MAYAKVRFFGNPSVLKSAAMGRPMTGSSSSEFILRALGASVDPPSAIRTDDDTAAASLDTFLSSRLTFTMDAKGQDVCMVKAGDNAEVGVMMGWEKPISQPKASS